MADPSPATLISSINTRLELLDTLLKSLRLQASRVTITLARYKTQTRTDGVFSNIHIPNPQFKDLQQYQQLIAKQFCGRLQQLRHSYLALKMETERIGKKMQSKAQPTDLQRLSVIGSAVRQFEVKFCEIWRQQHFLVLNYKLDCAAKEIQRWTAVAESNQKTPQMIRQVVNSMFS